MSLDPKRAARLTSSSKMKTASPSIGASPGWLGRKELLMGQGRVTSCLSREGDRMLRKIAAAFVLTVFASTGALWAEGKSDGKPEGKREGRAEKHSESVKIGTLAPAESPWGQVFRTWRRAVRERTKLPSQ